MTLNAQTYDTLYSIPYLNNVNNYINDLNNISLNGATYNPQTELKTYLSTRNNLLVQGDDFDNLDNDAISALYQNELVSNTQLKNKYQYIKALDNRVKNVENNKFYNSALLKMVQEDISLDSLDIKSMTADLHNKTRNLEIRNYYEDKMKEQIAIVKIVILIFLVLLALTFFYKLNVLSTNIYITLIGVGLACIVIFTIGKLFDIYLRDDVDFNEYGFIKSHHYLNKGDSELGADINPTETPLYAQDDLISNKCLTVSLKNKSE